MLHFATISQDAIQYYCIILNCALVYGISSTAQGGGGSLEKMKLIGEVGCCEAGLAEQLHWWTERGLELCF